MGFNYTAPMFIQVGGEESIDLQDVQLDASVGNRQANIQMLAANQLTTETYRWFKASGGQAGPSGKKQPVPAGKNGLWFKDDDGVYSWVTGVGFDWGDCIQLDAPSDDNLMMYNGQVSDKDVVRVDTRYGFNYFGNPYPAQISIQDVQLPTSVPNRGANIQILADNQLTTVTYRWFKASGGQAGPSGMKQPVPTGSNGLWFRDDDAVYSWETKNFASGEGFQLDLPEDDLEVTIFAPIEL